MRDPRRHRRARRDPRPRPGPHRPGQPDFLAALITATSGAVTPAGEIIARLRDADERREELARDWAAGEISRKEWHSARDEITAVMDKLTADLSRTRHSATLARFAAAGGSVWDRWETMTTGAAAP
jgi:hypothetical protein